MGKRSTKVPPEKCARVSSQVSTTFPDGQTDRQTAWQCTEETDSWTVCHFCAHSFKCRNKLTTQRRAKAEEEPQKKYHKNAQTADHLPQTPVSRRPLSDMTKWNACISQIVKPGQMKCCPPLWVAASPTSICITDACIDSIKVFQLGTFPSPPLSPPLSVSRSSSFTLYPH